MAAASSLWVDTYRPKHTSELIGQERNVARMKQWLKTFDSATKRPLFIYGPPGIGKTTAAQLCCKELGYQIAEFNASDQRNKNVIEDVIGTISSTSRISFTSRASETKEAIVLDEVDGMAGNEDRGGIGQLIQEIKRTKKAMIFICNDGQHQKLRSLKEKCDVIEFKRPDIDAIRAVVTKIARKEGLDLHKINLRNLAESSDFDIRQIVNSLSLFRDGDSDQIAKSTRLNAFEAAKKALTYSSKLTINDRFECFFSDYSIMPLFMFENYTKNKPIKSDHLWSVSRAANSFCLGDLVEKDIRTNQTWSLLNVQGLLSTVIPSKWVASSQVGGIGFPQFLGKLSNANKRARLVQELNNHMCLKLRGGLDTEYLDVLHQRLVVPLAKGDIESAVDVMNEYSLTRGDFDSVAELAAWNWHCSETRDTKHLTQSIDTKTKLALTNACKKRAVAMPYFVADSQKAKKRPLIGSELEENNEEEVEEDDDEPVMKPKKVVKKARISSPESSQSKPAKKSKTAAAKAAPEITSESQPKKKDETEPKKKGEPKPKADKKTQPPPLEEKVDIKAKKAKLFGLVLDEGRQKMLKG